MNQRSLLRRTLPAFDRLAQARTAGHVPAGIQPENMAPSQPDAYGPERGVFVRLPGANFPPAGATPVDVDGDASIAPGGTATLLSVAVPDTQRLRIVGIGFGADDEVALRFLTWSLSSNGVVLPGYTQKNAVVGSIVQLTEIFVLAGSSVTFTVDAAAAAAAIVTYRYICRIRGYLYAEKEQA